MVDFYGQNKLSLYLQFASRISLRVVQDFANAGLNIYQKDCYGNNGLFSAVCNPCLSYANVMQLGEMAAKSLRRISGSFNFADHQSNPVYDCRLDKRKLLKTYLHRRPQDDSRTISVLQAFAANDISLFEFPDLNPILATFNQGLRSVSHCLIDFMSR